MNNETVRLDLSCITISSIVVRALQRNHVNLADLEKVAVSSVDDVTNVFENNTGLSVIALCRNLEAVPIERVYDIWDKDSLDFPDRDQQPTIPADTQGLVTNVKTKPWLV